MYKRFCISFFALTICFLIVIGSIVYVVDPFNLYKKYDDVTNIIYQLPYYQNTGIAKNAKYDTLITGTSMTQNFRANWFNEKFGCNAVRLSYDGGIVDDFASLLSSAIENNTELNEVYFGLDNYLITDDSKLNEVSERILEYLTDDNYINDIKYLLNKDVLFNYIPTYFSNKLLSDYNFYDMNAWDTTNPEFSKEAVLEGYTEIEKETKKPETYFDEAADFMIDKIIPFVSENKDIHFTFFAPPYSILYWHKLVQKGTLDATVYSLKRVYKELLSYDNVSLYYFQNDYKRITDLDKYKDFSHYCTDYNKYMLECFGTDQYKLSADSVEVNLDEMRAYCIAYDYNSLIFN